MIELPKDEKRRKLWRRRLDDLRLVQEAAIKSPLIEVPATIGNNNKILLKLESEQKIKSFKIRGATYALASDLESLRRRGVVADSGGNHAQAVALAGRELGVPVRIIMAAVVPENKKEATRFFGATDGSFELDTTPETFVDAKVKAKQVAHLDADGKPPKNADSYPKYLSPYDDPAILRGTGTIVPEVVLQLEGRGWDMPRAFHVPVGGGGLIGGIADVNAEQGHLFDLYGHGLTGADSGARSLRSNEPVPVEGDPNILAEGLAVKVIGDQGHQRMRDGKIDDIATSTLAEVGEAYDWYIKNVLPVLGVDTADQEAVWNNIPELSSMVAVAGALKQLRKFGVRNETHLVLISGGNINRERAQKAMDAFSDGAQTLN